MRIPPRRLIISTIIFVLTIAAFANYVRLHPEYLSQLHDIQPLWLILIVGANLVAFFALNLLYDVLVRMTGNRLPSKENLLLTIYSSIANFFGPLQSGPGVRAGYLRAKHKVSLKAYFIVTLFYYAIFAIINAFFLLIGTRPWWQAALASLAVAAISIAVIRYSAAKRKKELKLLVLTPTLISSLIVLTLMQVVFIGIRFYFALQAAGADVSIGQAMSYTGAANFAVFVSFTPDGIGIREAFLLFAQNLHHVSVSDIVTANIIDRASYLLFLGVLFIAAISMHAKDKLKIGSFRKPQVEAPETDGTPKSFF